MLSDLGQPLHDAAGRKLRQTSQQMCGFWTEAGTTAFIPTGPLLSPILEPDHPEEQV